MKYTSQVYTDARGSIGGTTYSRNRGGLYTRGRGKPSMPSTPAQKSIRDAVSFIAQAWSSTLTPTQRDGWSLYGQSNPVLNKLGNSITLSGINMFVRVNTPLVAAGGSAALVPDGPGATPFLGPLNFDSGFADDGTTISGDLLNSVDFAIGDYIFVYVTRAVAAGVTPAHQPEKLVAAIKLGAVPTVPTTYPLSESDPFAVNRATGQPYRLRAMWIRAGNMSSSAYYTDLIT